MHDRQDVILGAGLAGLTAAHTLAEAGETGWIVLERDGEVGGHARTVVVDGYAFDLGPHILFASDVEMARLIRDLLGDNLREQARRAGIYHEAYGVYTRFPFQAHLYGLPVDVVRDCLVELVRAVERRARGEFSPGNYEEWMRGVFGDAISERLMIPYARKLWTVEPSEMEFSWIHRRVPTPDVARIVLGALTDEVEQIGATAAFWYPWEGGAQALPVALAERVEGIQLGRELVSIDTSSRTLRLADGEEMSYRRLLWTLPLTLLPEISTTLPDHIRDACSRLRFQGILNINLGVDRPTLSEFHWIYFYEDGFPFHRLSFPGSFSPQNVPEGKSSIATEVAFAPGQPPEHDRAVEETVAALRRAGILRDEDRIELVHVEEITPAYVIYDLEHAATVALIRGWLAEQGVSTAGRFGEWGYLNMDQAMASGRRAAKSLVATGSS